MKKMLCAIAIVALAPSAASAGRPPSDIELRAAYCLGRLEGAHLDPTKYPPGFQANIKKANSEVSLARRRLQLYLEPKYYLDQDAILMAASRGKEAQNKTADACMGNPESDQCLFLSKDSAGCRNPTFLPF